MIRRCVVRTVNTEFKSRVKRSPIQAGFHLRRSQCRSRNQKRRTLRSSENSVLIALTTMSFTIKWKLGRRSRKQKRNNYETNHTKRRNVPWDGFILPPLLPTPTIWFSLDRISGVGRKRKRSDSSNSHSIALITLFKTPIFYLHCVISALTTPAFRPEPEKDGPNTT